MISNTSALPEAGGPCAAYVDPNSVEQMSDTLQNLIKDNHQLRSLKREIRKHTENFKLENCTNSYVKTLYTLI